VHQAMASSAGGQKSCGGGTEAGGSVVGGEARSTATHNSKVTLGGGPLPEGAEEGGARTKRRRSWPVVGSRAAATLRPCCVLRHTLGTAAADARAGEKATPVEQAAVYAGLAAAAAAEGLGSRETLVRQAASRVARKRSLTWSYVDGGSAPRRP
jgi:hypothetical protein